MTYGLHFSVILFSFSNILPQMKNAVELQSVFSIFALENEKEVADFIKLIFKTSPVLGYKA